MEYVREALLFDPIIAQTTVSRLTRIQIEFGFAFQKEPDGHLIARGSQGVVWTNAGHQPGRMPEELFRNIAEYFGLGGTERKKALD
jgi:acyl-CoA thioesterase FadM